MARIERDVVQRDWAQQLRHQLPILPPVEGFLEELPDAIAWWLEPARAAEPLEPIPAGRDKKRRHASGFRLWYRLAQGAAQHGLRLALAGLPWSGFDSRLATGCALKFATTE